MKRALFVGSIRLRSTMAVTVIATFLSAGPAYAQETAHTGRAWSAALVNTATAIPYTRFITTPVHPGIQLATEFPLKMGEHGRIYVEAHAGYLYHANLYQGIFLGGDGAYEYRLKNGLAFGALFGVNYLHTFATATEWRFINGRYVQKADAGNARLMPSLSLEAGYFLGGSMERPKFFLRYQSWLEYPYSPDFIPVITHINLMLGMRMVIGGTKPTAP